MQFITDTLFSWVPFASVGLYLLWLIFGAISRVAFALESMIHQLRKEKHNVSKKE